MAGTLILNSISPDVGTNLYLNATQGAGNVVIGNTTTALATFTNAGTLIVGNVIGSIANTNITGNITSSQITSVANTQITGTITNNVNSTLITANTLVLSNSIITSGAVINATTQTSIEFTALPSWVKRITLMVNGLSTNSSGNILIQLGTGSTSYTTSGYLGSCSYISSGASTTAFTTGFGIVNATGTTAFVVQGSVVLNNLSGNIWVASGVLGESDSARTLTTGGGVTLGAVLTAVRLYIDGTQQFDAGSINILYE